MSFDIAYTIEIEMMAAADTERRLPMWWVVALSPFLSCAALGAASALAEPASIAYVSSEGTGSLSGIDTSSFRVVQDVYVGRRPHNMERTADGWLLVATQGSNTVAVVDTRSEPATVDRIDLGVPPHDVAARAGRATAFVVSERGLLAEIDPASGRVLRRVELKGRPHDVTAWRGSALITDISASRIFIVEGDRVSTMPISVVGHDLAVLPGSEELWVTPWTSDRAVVIDLEKREQIAEFKVGLASSHKHLAFSEDGGEAWISEPESGSLFVVNTRTRTVVYTIALGGHPHHVRVSAGRVYIADGPSDLIVLDAASRQVLAHLAVGAEVHDVAVVTR